jgi:hypothetical protein
MNPNPNYWSKLRMNQEKTLVPKNRNPLDGVRDCKKGSSSSDLPLTQLLSKLEKI